MIGINVQQILTFVGRIETIKLNYREQATDLPSNKFQTNKDHAPSVLAPSAPLRQFDNRNTQSFAGTFYTHPV